MAKEYIEREAAIAAVDCTQVIVGDWIRDNIQNIPAADVRPVVHAHWEQDESGEGFWVCTNPKCGDVSEASMAHRLYKYCPFCGAVMDEEVGDG